MVGCTTAFNKAPVHFDVYIAHVLQDQADHPHKGPGVPQASQTNLTSWLGIC